ncbi:uncharacterized protein LOC128278468 [Anopheles cruzii]|uniref:uncharacterized protein LOC128278468 n=1 Tax=Anopheles cruzii TaxID=68878 RepID=UPI0022EC220A|nr:uncharacterized protein LOC128278468 [Anopheles cruzii]
MLHTNNGAVTALDLHYAEATRFLVVCNADRRLKVYDLQSGRYQPLEVCNIVTRSRCTAVRWLVHFPVLTMIYDDSYALDRCAYTIHQPREIGLRMFPLCSIGAEATDMSANEWLGTNMFATDGGDLLYHRPIAFVCNTHERKSTNMLTSTVTIRLEENDDNSTNLSSYEAFSGRFGLLFSDTDGVSWRLFSFSPACGLM